MKYCKIYNFIYQAYYLEFLQAAMIALLTRFAFHLLLVLRTISVLLNVSALVNLVTMSSLMEPFVKGIFLSVVNY